MFSSSTLASAAFLSFSALLSFVLLPIIVPCLYLDSQSWADVVCVRALQNLPLIIVRCIFYYQVLSYMTASKGFSTFSFCINSSFFLKCICALSCILNFNQSTTPERKWSRIFIFIYNIIFSQFHKSSKKVITI